MKQKNINLINARTDKNYTQQYMADELGISIRQYQRYENEEKIPNVILSKKISQLLSKPIEILF